MKVALRLLSIISGVAVVIGGLYLVWKHLSPDDLQGHYEPLGAFIDYVLRFGLIAVFGFVCGIGGKSSIGICVNLSYILFVSIIYLID